MSDFIDRAKLEAQAYEQWPKRWESTSDEVYRPDDPIREPERDAYMAGVDAVLALLDAETTEEWGVGPSEAGEPDQFTGTEGTARMVAERDSIRLFPVVVYSRRVLYGPWLPSEGGES